MKNKSLKLNRLEENELTSREMKKISGGNWCVCGCHYAGQGGSSTRDNGCANSGSGKGSPGGGELWWC